MGNKLTSSSSTNNTASGQPPAREAATTPTPTPEQQSPEQVGKAAGHKSGAISRLFGKWKASWSRSRNAVPQRVPSRSRSSYKAATGGASNETLLSSNSTLYTYAGPRVPAPTRSTPALVSEPTPAPLPQNNVGHRVLFTYVGGPNGHVPAQEDDVVEVMPDAEKRAPAGWLLVRTAQGVEGLFPEKFLVPVGDTPEAHAAYRNVLRAEAERLLLYPNTPIGTYLVRPRDEQNSYSLSCLHFFEDTFRPTVKHFILGFDPHRREYKCAGISNQSFGKLIESFNSPESSALGLKLTGPVQRTFRPPLTFTQLELQRDAIVCVKLLGEGNFGEVWLGKLYRKVDVAVKKLKPGSMPEKKFLEEARIMHTLSHRNVVQILGVVTDGEPLVVSEFMPNGAVLDYLRKQKQEKQDVPRYQLLEIMIDIAAGCIYLEQNKVIHRDIRAANVLLDENLQAKVADFGLARLLQHVSNDEAIFPARWTAPEAFSAHKFTHHSDVWSYGIVLWEIVTYGRIPYPDTPNNNAVFEKVCRGYRLPNPEGHRLHPEDEPLAKWCPMKLHHLMLNCWRTDPESRPNFAALKSHLETLLAHVQDETQSSEKALFDDVR